ncbi:hypothetical protein GSI_05416 [Ganoderma sinense ZZ0214-1]|uniref:UBX domain-containing protein n=1 Tax=Ganoderma sinense ZZ0214-1 TaxID=1077348 RepID=A0A2G8SEI9_9APHY|nr:hypothetical protein GSI_05416 [Ganoderma sinense ZZ0214-1]
MSESPPQSATPTPSTSAQDPAPVEPAKPAFRYFRAPTSAQQPRVDVPDSFFDATTSDIRAQQASLTARSNALQNAPLRTAAMRDADDKKRRARWPQTTIRVRFPDCTVLEKTFPSSDKIKSVYAFVRGSLREDVKPIKFVLYQSPPKREYKVSDPAVRNLSLAELDFAPSSLLMLQFEDPTLNHQNIPAPLDPSVLAVIEDYPVPRTLEATTTKDDKSDGSKPRSNFTFGKKDENGERKLPKWLKLGPK